MASYTLELTESEVKALDIALSVLFAQHNIKNSNLENINAKLDLITGIIKRREIEFAKLNKK